MRWCSTVPSHFDFALSGPFGNRSPAITLCHHARGSAAKRLDRLRRVTASTQCVVEVRINRVGHAVRVVCRHSASSLGKYCSHAAALFSFGLELPSERQLLASRMPAVGVENTITS
jgi:hypothetical protein